MSSGRTGKPRGRPPKGGHKVITHVLRGKYTCDLMVPRANKPAKKRAEYLIALQDYVGSAEATRHSAVCWKAISLENLARRNWT